MGFVTAMIATFHCTRSESLTNSIPRKRRALWQDNKRISWSDQQTTIEFVRIMSIFLAACPAAQRTIALSCLLSDINGAAQLPSSGPPQIGQYSRSSWSGMRADDAVLLYSTDLLCGNEVITDDGIFHLAAPSKHIWADLTMSQDQGKCFASLAGGAGGGGVRNVCPCISFVGICLFDCWLMRRWQDGWWLMVADKKWRL